MKYPCPHKVSHKTPSLDRFSNAKPYLLSTRLRENLLTASEKLGFVICAMAKLHDVWFMVIPCHGNPEKMGVQYILLYYIIYYYIILYYILYYIILYYIIYIPTTGLIIPILTLIYRSRLADLVKPFFGSPFVASLMIFIGRMMLNSCILDEFGATVLSEKAFLKHAVSGYWWDFESQPSKT